MGRKAGGRLAAEKTLSLRQGESMLSLLKAHGSFQRASPLRTAKPARNGHELNFFFAWNRGMVLKIKHFPLIIKNLEFA